jgi:hypothetical protein
MNKELDKPKLLDLLQAEFAFVERTLALLTPEQVLIPNVEGWWSVKDTIAHLTAWMRRLLQWFASVRKGEAPHIPDVGYEWKQMDELNDRTSEADKNRTWDDVLSEFRRVHAQVVQLVESLSESEIFESDFNGLFHEPPANLIIDNSYGHYLEHFTAVRRWIASQKTAKS